MNRKYFHIMPAVYFSGYLTPEEVAENFMKLSTKIKKEVSKIDRAIEKGNTNIPVARPNRLVKRAILTAQIASFSFGVPANPITQQNSAGLQSAMADVVRQVNVYGSDPATYEQAKQSMQESLKQLDAELQSYMKSHNPHTIIAQPLSETEESNNNTLQ